MVVIVIFSEKCLVQFLSLLSFPKVVVGNLLFVVAVILESRSPGSVVIKQGKIVPLFGLYTQNDRLIYPRTLRAGSLRGPPAPLWDNTLSNCHPGRGPGIQSVY